MIRALFCSLTAFAGISAAPALAAECLDDVVILRAATIEDASGRWENQDVLIEAGMIAAMGGELTLSGGNVAEIDLSGHVLSPLVETDVLVIQTSMALAPRSQANAMLLAGEPASLQIARADGTVLGQLRDGQPTGQCFIG